MDDLDIPNEGLLTFIAEWKKHRETRELATDLHDFFAAVEHRFLDYLDVAEEGRGLWQLMFDEEIEDGSASSDLFDCIAAAAYFLGRRNERNGLTDEDVLRRRKAEYDARHRDKPASSGGGG